MNINELNKFNEELDKMLNESESPKYVGGLTEDILKDNIDVSFKILDKSDSNIISWDGIGYCVDIFEFMVGDIPMYSALTRFKELEDAKYAAKIINRNRSNYDDCIRLIPNYDKKQI